MNMFSPLANRSILFEVTQVNMLLAHSKRSSARSTAPRRSKFRRCVQNVTSHLRILETLGDVHAAMISEPQAGLRLDRALGELFPGNSRSAMARLIEEGHVRVDGRAAVKPSQRVE